MREFLRGWRQKAGCVTLLMAMAVSGLWMRSWTTSDYFRFQIGDRQHRLSSTKDSGLAWESWDAANPWNEEVVIDRMGDDSIVRYRTITREFPRVKESPHLLVVVILLGISACLIFWIPRKQPGHA